MNVAATANKLQVADARSGLVLFTELAHTFPRELSGGLTLIGSPSERVHLLTEWLIAELLVCDQNDPVTVNNLTVMVNAIADVLDLTTVVKEA